MQYMVLIVLLKLIVYCWKLNESNINLERKAFYFTDKVPLKQNISQVCKVEMLLTRDEKSLSRYKAELTNFISEVYERESWLLVLWVYSLLLYC